ncbi:neutral zinc metallopeptidase [Kribbella deserti]|uniref:Neutral zinc metallopeptidase n=1 Tax=Kribbella deserti TaxID=1926257 RepID=A0ABV6QIH4_9ACTN
MSSSIIRRGLVAAAALALTAVTAMSGVASNAATTAPPSQAPDPFIRPTTPTHGDGDWNMLGKSTGLTYKTALTPTSAWNTVKYNKIYKTGRVYPSKCGQPKYALNGSANIRAWHLSYGYCLNKSWVGKVQAAGYKFVAPTWVIYSKPFQTPCGYANGTRAFYCSASRGIYIPVKPIIDRYKINARHNLVAVMQTAAHEYAHHVQAMTGILNAQYYRQQYVLNTSAKDLEENRRMELQATCWASVYVGTNRGYLGVTPGGRLNDYKWVISHIGDDYNPPGAPRTHGTRVNNNWWATNGFNYMNAGSCATWNGSSSIVA